jgi:hypothetical protein
LPWIASGEVKEAVRAAGGHCVAKFYFMGVRSDPVIAQITPKRKAQRGNLTSRVQPIKNNAPRSESLKEETAADLILYEFLHPSSQPHLQKFNWQQNKGQNARES